ncbi:MAG: DUF899 family protein [Rhodospirillaceae bacterium]|nr:DUF899 family protein [Rhodospirillaceae bacterium]
MTLHQTRFPNETAGYRSARDALLDAEIALRRQIEALAAQRRALPAGGALKEDYAFIEGPRDLAVDGPETKTKLSSLFGAHDTLLLYSLMQKAGGKPCPGCTSVLDALQGNVPQIEDRAAFAVVAKAPVAAIRQWACERHWRNPRFLSSGDTTYNADYHAEKADGSQMPIMNVFRRAKDGTIRHHWGSELLFVPAEPGQDDRHVDTMWPLWNALDLTPGGRGDGFPDGTFKRSLE